MSVVEATRVRGYPCHPSHFCETPLFFYTLRGAEDGAGERARAETVVDIHHREPGRARVEHGEERGDAMEARAVADARRHADDRAGHEAGDDAGKGALHPGDHDQAGRALQAIELREETVYARDAHVVDAVHGRAD